MHVTGATGSAATYYTTDGTNPKTSASWQRYTRPFALSGPTTLRFYSKDAASRSEAAQTQHVRAAVAQMAGSDGPGRTLGVTPSRRLIAGASFAVLVVMFFGGIGLLWKGVARRRLQPRR
jgi:hypothetical protein